MDSEWMGRYRPLVAAVIRQTNIAIKDFTSRHDIGEGIILNNNEWQTLEYIVEHREDDERMSIISENLSIPQSSFSKIVQRLVRYKLVERYRMSNNKKNIILKPTDLGVDLYRRNVEEVVAPRFEGFFHALEQLSDSDLAVVTKAFEIFNHDIESTIPQYNCAEKEKTELIKL